MKVIMCEPGKRAYETEVGNKLEDLYDALDCELIQVVYPFEENVMIVCDENGKMEGKELNRALRNENGEIYDIIAGKFLICRAGDDGDMVSLSEGQLIFYKKMFLLPEQAFMLDGKIYSETYEPKEETENE